MKRILAVLGLAAVLSLAADKKTDDALYDQVRLKLTGDPNVNGGALDVEVKDGAVTLKGKVRTERARQRAEKITKKVKGVKSVDNQLQIDINAH